MKRGEFLIRDVRTKSHFIVDDEYLNGWSRLCGPNATLVYFCLCRHADTAQKSFPSVILMAEKTGISPRSVSRGIATLLEMKIIAKDRVRNPSSGRWWHNSYLLLDKSEWMKPPHATLASGPHANSDIHHMPHWHAKDSHSKDSHKNDFSGEKSTLNPFKEEIIVSDIKDTAVKKSSDPLTERVLRAFQDRCEKEIGQRPRDTIKARTVIKHAMNRLSFSELPDHLAYWFSLQKKDQDLMQPSQAFSDYALDGFYAN